MRRVVHGLVIWLSGKLSALLPDRIPVTFVGPGSVEELCESIAQARHRKLLVVTDAMLVELGLVERVLESLRAVGVEAAVYDGIEPDPTFPQVEEGLARLESEGCDAILALGGGSPMDAAKVIAGAATNGRNARALEGMFKFRKAPVPLYAIPTTAGTGSEVTVAAVVSDPETHAKKFFIDPKLLPRMTALDPTLMTGLPPQVTAATGMDALTHAVESFIARTSNPQTEVWATTAVRLVFDNLPTAHQNGSDLAARKAMALASYYAGLAFTRTSVGYAHAIAHTFGAFYRTPHGWANAIALPNVLDFSLEAATGKLARLAEIIDLEGADDQELARNFIAAVRELKSKVDIPATLDALKEEDIPRIARQAVDEAHLNYPVPRYMSQPECETLLRQMLT